MVPQRSASWPGTIGEGNEVSPMSQRSTAAAAERPSAMAHTIRLWPRVWSPQTKTPSTLVAQAGVRRHGAPAVDLQPELGHRAPALGAHEAHGQEHQLALQLELGAHHLLEHRTPVSR